MAPFLSGRSTLRPTVSLGHVRKYVKPSIGRKARTLSDEPSPRIAAIRKAGFAWGKVDPREAQRKSVESREARILANLTLAKEAIANAAPRAAERIVDTVDADRDDIALRAAADVLDRAGVSRTQAVDVQVEAGDRLASLIERLDARERETIDLDPVPPLGGNPETNAGTPY